MDEVGKMQMLQILNELPVEILVNLYSEGRECLILEDGHITGVEENY